MGWDLVIGGVGLCLSAVALEPILFPPPPDCKPILAQLTLAEQDKGSAKLSLNAAQQKLKQLRTDQSANSSRKSRVEGFLQEQDFADEMRAYAQALSAIASDFDERFEIFQPLTDETFINVVRDRPQLISDFKTALASEDVIPDTSRAIREKRLVFMEFGFEPFDYRVFDALPRYPDEARAMTDRLLRAAGDPGPHSSWMWGDGSWSNTYRAFGAGEELIDLNANLAKLADEITQQVLLVDQLEERVRTQTGTETAMQALLAEFECSLE